MTFCLGIRVKQGLVGIADTRITSGSECTTARKVAIYQQAGRSIFLMTSGLRSVRDKTLAYFDEAMEDLPTGTNRLFKLVNLFTQQIRRVAQEDKAALDEANLHFNIHAMIGGQLENDREHKLYLVYPQGNWVEIGEGTPYHIIGASGYGKPVLDRVLTYDDSLRLALKVGFLAFDSTRISATDVDFPLDVVVYARDTFQIVEHRYHRDDLIPTSSKWQSRLRDAVNQMPSDWIDRINHPLAQKLLSATSDQPIPIRSQLA